MLAQQLKVPTAPMTMSIVADRASARSRWAIADRGPDSTGTATAIPHPRIDAAAAAVAHAVTRRQPSTQDDAAAVRGARPARRGRPAIRPAAPPPDPGPHRRRWPAPG